MIKNVVFDLDDTLWPLNKKAAAMAKIELSKLTNFVVEDNILLTSNEKRRLLEVYNSIDLWKDIQYEPKATEIYKLEELNAKVYINSNCLTQEIADFKRSFLSDVFNLPQNQIILNVVSCPRDKRMIDNMFIFADDSPFNIAKSTAKYNLVPNKAWNRVIHNENIHRFDSFEELYNFCTNTLISCL